MQKDWVGDKNSIFKCLSANSHCNHEYEENSFYATDSKALELFLDRIEKDNIKITLKYIVIYGNVLVEKEI